MKGVKRKLLGAVFLSFAVSPCYAHRQQQYANGTLDVNSLRLNSETKR